MGTLTKLDLPKAVRYRPRSKSSDGGRSPQIPRAALEGRSIPGRGIEVTLEGRRWSDFQALDAADRENAVEMDTVVGRQGKDEQCVLTMFVRRIGFQFYILLPDKTTESVIHAIDTFQDIYGTRFGKVFSLVVCDRGSEFADAERIEHGKNGKRRGCTTRTLSGPSRSPEPSDAMPSSGASFPRARSTSTGSPAATWRLA